MTAGNLARTIVEDAVPKALDHMKDHVSMPKALDIPDRYTGRLTKGIALFSLGLGLTQLLAPHFIGRKLGMKDDGAKLLRGYGIREISSGLGLLLSRNPAHHMWSRVIGDGHDLASLMQMPQRESSAARRNVKIAVAAVAGIAVLDMMMASKLSKRRK